MTILPKDNNGCPYLILAPMEGVGDCYFRRAMAKIGGFDEAVTEFIRVPTNAHVKSLVRGYNPCETYPIPQAAQLMGSDANLMAAMAVELEKMGAPRIDINCGCPSNTVTGKAAGSSLLKDPDLLYKLVKNIVDAVAIPVTVKMRSGFIDTSLFKENMLAAQSGGVKFICLHPRTKIEGYKPPANWDLIKQAKSILTIPVVGNGDILTASDAVRMLNETGCDALMIGRGAIINPFIFYQIKAHFSGSDYLIDYENLHKFLLFFIAEFPKNSPQRFRMNKLKQLMSYLFTRNLDLLEKRKNILSFDKTDCDDFVSYVLPFLQEYWC